MANILEGPPTLTLPLWGRGFVVIVTGHWGYVNARRGLEPGRGLRLLVAEEFAGENHPEGKQSNKSSGGGDG